VDVELSVSPKIDGTFNRIIASWGGSRLQDQDAGTLDGEPSGNAQELMQHPGNK
jgi:hypothetical protein